MKWTIVPIPEWAQGTFKGTLFSEDWSSLGSFTLTVGKTGKVSDKFVNLKKVQYLFAVGLFKSFADGMLQTKANMKYGTKTLPVEIAVGYEECEGEGGETESIGFAEVLVKSGTATFGSALLNR